MKHVLKDHDPYCPHKSVSLPYECNLCPVIAKVRLDERQKTVAESPAPVKNHKIGMIDGLDYCVNKISEYLESFPPRNREHFEGCDLFHPECALDIAIKRILI